MNRIIIVVALTLSVAGCTGFLTEARQVVDQWTAAIVEKNQQVLVEADIERKRLRRLRCHLPNLTPNALSVAADNPQLGPDWIDELLEDCPQFRGFILDLGVRQIGKIKEE